MCMNSNAFKKGNEYPSIYSREDENANDNIHIETYMPTDGDFRATNSESNQDRSIKLL
jgi:hypothetical protein